MEHTLGGTAILLAALVTALLARRHSALSLVLAVAFLVRAGAALFHFYVAPLPDGVADAVSFEHLAWEWGREGAAGAVGHFTLDSYFYSWLMALLYSVSDRSPLMLQGLSVLAGVVGVFASWLLTAELWGERAANKAAWVMALFPTVVMYGALTMREAYIVLFILIGLIGVTRWARDGNVQSIVVGLAGLGIASFFHGGVFVAILAFMGIVAARAAKRWLAGLARYRLRILSMIGLVLVLALTAGYVFSGANVHKLGTLEQLVSPERWLFYFESRTRGSAAYPDWSVPHSAVDLIWAVPTRTVYLLFGPFPWDISSPAHLIALGDGLLYLVLGVLTWRNRRAIWASPEARAVLLVTTPLVLAFAVGTGNFGTALRHRAKFVAAFVVLAAPKLPKFVVHSDTSGSPETPKAG